MPDGLNTPHARTMPSTTITKRTRLSGSSDPVSISTIHASQSEIQRQTKQTRTKLARQHNAQSARQNAISPNAHELLGSSRTTSGGCTPGIDVMDTVDKLHSPFKPSLSAPYPYGCPILATEPYLRHVTEEHFHTNKPILRKAIRNIKQEVKYIRRWKAAA